MKKTLEIFLLDWKRIVKAPLTLALVVALIILPSLYAWFNIAALWDPYSNTGDLKVAVYSDDAGAKFQDKNIQIGDDLVNSLKENDKLGWTFVTSKKEMDKGVQSGKYYASIYIPKNFSNDLISFINGDIKKPEIIYSVNQKINAIAPKITSSGASTLQQTITQEFTATVSSTVIGVFNQLGVKLETNLPTIQKISSLIFNINDHIDEIDLYAQEVIDLQQKLPALETKLGKANKGIAYLPVVNEMADKVVRINGFMPQVDAIGQKIVGLETKIPAIENVGTQINAIDTEFDQVVAVLNDGVAEAESALSIIQQVQLVLPDIITLTQNGGEYTLSAQNFLNQLNASLTTVAPAIKEGLAITNQITANITGITQEILDGGLSNQEIKDKLQKLSAQFNTTNETISGLIDTLKNLQEIHSSPILAAQIQKLETLQQSIQGIDGKITQVIADLDGGLDIRSKVQQIHDTALMIQGQTGVMVANFDTVILPGIQEVIEKLTQDLTTAQNILNQANTTILPNISDLLTSTSGTITQALTVVQEYQNQIPLLKGKIHEANLLLNGNMDLIVNSIRTASHFYQEDFPDLKNKLGNASLFIQNDLPTIEEELVSTLTMVNEKWPTIESAVQTAGDLIQNDWPMLKSGITKAADALTKQKDNVDLGEVIALLKSDANAESDFLSDPVKLTEKNIYPIPNYGSASTPFYTALCLWVGAVLLSSIFKTKVDLKGEKDVANPKRYKPIHLFYGRMLTFLAVGFLQALVVALGNIFLLDTYGVNKGWFVVFTLLVGLVFMAIVYVLVALLGNLGKGAAIIILVLSISAAGGNFPVELSAPFFQIVNPALPFTYAVNLLRESVGGIYWANAWKDILVLTTFGVSFTVLGGFLLKYLAKPMYILSEKVEKGKIIH